MTFTLRLYRTPVTVTFHPVLSFAVIVVYKLLWLLPTFRQMWWVVMGYQH